MDERTRERSRVPEAELQAKIAESRALVQKALLRIQLTPAQRLEIVDAWQLHLRALRVGAEKTSEEYQRILDVTGRIEGEYLDSLPRSEKAARAHTWSEERLREWDRSLDAPENGGAVLRSGGKDGLRWVRAYIETVRDYTALAEALIMAGDRPRAWKYLKLLIALVAKTEERFDGIKFNFPALNAFRAATRYEATEDSVFEHLQAVQNQFEAALD